MSRSMITACLTPVFLVLVGGFEPAVSQADSEVFTSVTASRGLVLRRKLDAGEAVEISARIEQPGRLPANVRLRAEWKGVETDNSADEVTFKKNQTEATADRFGIYTDPTPNWSKVLHALDGDLYLIYRAPVGGTYELSVTAEQGEVTLFSGPRWREDGTAPQSVSIPGSVVWSDGTEIDVSASIEPIDLEPGALSDLVVEAEPNDTPEQAQPISLPSTDEVVLNVTGTSDDIEYFDNGRVGSSGDDWFRIEFAGTESRLLTACLSIPDQQVAARIRAYRLSAEDADSSSSLLAIEEYEDGKNPNERAHQQEEQHRTAINRTLEPGGVYFLRVEANAPAYDLELRVVRPAPYDDPRKAIRHGLYDHIGQVDAWLTNRPRGASVERRIRDSGNLLGTNCMSCHTQSGVWGPAVPFEFGYRPQNVQAWRHLINTCYQSMRPTNKLVDAANNTSLKPLDLGDGPAGTRVAGHAVVSLERFLVPRKLQSKQAIRAANFVLQSGDPGGINAAGPGANVGQGVVFNYAGEIVESAWRQTGEARYFHTLQDKARRMLEIDVKYADDLGHRVEFFRRYFPTEYVKDSARVVQQEQLDEERKAEVLRQASVLQQRIERQVKEDLARLRQIQLEDGGWSFDPGTHDEQSGTYTVSDTKPDPSPTAVALIAFHATGVGRDDATVAKGIRALLRMQHPTGYWNGASKTGFVSTSYALHALARYYPTEPPVYAADQFRPREGESLVDTIRRVRQLSMTEDPRLVDLMVEASGHESPLVRYWAMIALGTTRDDRSIPPLIAGLGDRTKVVREAAHWGLRQQLIDDRGWDAVLEAARTGDDYTREAALRALVMKVDGVLPKTAVDWKSLTDVFGHALNDDPHPAVRAWATRAAWQWWIWNPPVRPALNAAWQRLIEREEPDALVENAIRYQSHALFIANGHVANASKEHQYEELAHLFENLHDSLSAARETDEQRYRRVSDRLVAVAATYFNQRGGDGGPGQLGYSTPGAARLFGDVILSGLARVEAQPEGEARRTWTKIALEGAANLPHRELQKKLVVYSLEGPEELRSLAAGSISDPRLVSLVAVSEQLEPMVRQLLRGAADPPRRKDLSEPILKMFGGVRWILPESHEGRHDILQYLIPDTSSWKTPETVEAMTDAAERAQASRKADAVWYLADGLGGAVERNPDLHFEQLAERFPQQFTNAAEARYWIQSAPWILSFERELPEVQIDPRELPPVDPYEELRSRVVRLFVTQLGPDAQAENRTLAVDLANKTALRRNPEVLTALAGLEAFEKDEQVLEGAKKVLSQERGAFEEQLAEAVAEQSSHPFATGDDGKAELPDDFVEDVVYFRDYVVPEMARVLRGDERSCMICHGEPGRVPSMELNAPDQVGFLPVEQLLANYRILQQRIDLDNLQMSKLLRKPLNVQSGEEDGHQGGRRYQPMDPGYQILRRWVMNQGVLQRKYTVAPAGSE